MVFSSMLFVVSAAGGGRKSPNLLQFPGSAHAEKPIFGDFFEACGAFCPIPAGFYASGGAESSLCA
jgi:hypothetical protein